MIPQDMLIAAYTPFLDPLPVDRWWLLLLLPLVAVISIVYKAIKIDDLRQLPRQAASLAAQILVFLVLTAAALLLISELM
ncbi:MAG: hypothetical protein KIT87_26830 [Anaerolineae bacterium]|nr:hypothetical protein [Anaerolineae bacterium]